MRRPPMHRAGALILMAAGATAISGCIHNHYYGTVPPACSTTELGPVSIGSVCEVPPRVGGGTVVSQAPAGPNAPRVVVSEPARGPRLSWRRSDPEAGLATTRVEGGLDESVNR